MISVETVEARLTALSDLHESEMNSMRKAHDETRGRLRELEARERNYLIKGVMALGTMVAASGFVGWGVSKL